MIKALFEMLPESELSLLRRPEPSNRLVPGHIAFEENGTIIWAGRVQDLGDAPARVGFAVWHQHEGNRYLVGAYA